VAPVRKNVRAPQVRFEFPSQASPPSLRHLLRGSHGGKIAYAAQGILSAAMDNTLRLNRLAAAYGF
jgi:hypothetical protein